MLKDYILIMIQLGIVRNNLLTNGFQIKRKLHLDHPVFREFILS